MMPTASSPAVPSLNILDASAMMAFASGEPGRDVVAAAFADPNAICFAHSVNVFEVYYQMRRTSGEQVAQATVWEIQFQGVQIRDDLDRPFWEEAGRVKADRGRISIADCFGVVLAMRLGGQFLTADHGELDTLAADGFPITFIRTDAEFRAWQDAQRSGPAA